MIRAVVFLLVLILPAGCAARASGVNPAVRTELTSSGKVRVGIGVGAAASAFWAVKDPVTGEPRGVTVDLARALANALGTQLDLVVYANSGELVEAAARGEWDASFVPVDDARRVLVDFGPAYYFFDSTYLVKAASAIRTIADVDRTGVTVVGIGETTTGRASRASLQRAQFVSVRTVTEAEEMLLGGRADAVALSRESLESLGKRLADTRILDGHFQATGVAVAVPKGRSASLAYLTQFIEGALTSGLVQQALDGAGIRGQAAVPESRSSTPFKLGTFDRQGQRFAGIVLDDSLVIDVAAAHRLVSPRSALPAPIDMKDLIARYDTGLRERIGQIVAAVKSASGPRPPYVHELKALKVLPPIMYPTTMMNVAVNYREHDVEMAAVRAGSPGQTAPTAGGALPGTVSAPGIWERREDDPRWNPFMFLKAPAAVIADGEAVRLPPRRTQVEWECELAVVIGRPAAAVPADRAMDYVFGYTLENDISDRGGRGDTRYGSDWLVTKNHDTFAPMGPFITPKEFVKDPGNLPIRFLLNGQQLQTGSTSQMIHTIPEQLAYATALLTLRPGDVIATGTVPGSGSARTPPIFLKAGDRMACTYEGIGTLTNPVAATASQP